MKKGFEKYENIAKNLSTCKHDWSEQTVDGSEIINKKIRALFGGSQRTSLFTVIKYFIQKDR